MIDPGLEDKVVLITGAQHGIGAATAVAFASQGTEVFVQFLRLPLDDSQSAEAKPEKPGERLYRWRQSKSGETVVQEIRESGGQAKAWETDLSDPDAVSLLFDRAEGAFGSVNILVNNAAHWEPDSFLAPSLETASSRLDLWTDPEGSIDVATHDRHFAVNSRGAALMMAEFARRHIQREAHWGRIINISTDGSSCFPGEISYGASKHALESYSRSAAQELGRYGITVNVVSPGPIQTGYITPELEESLMPDIPLRRIGQPDDVADVIVFVASEQARWVTGQLLYVGGGHVMPQ